MMRYFVHSLYLIFDSDPAMQNFFPLPSAAAKAHSPCALPAGLSNHWRSTLPGDSGNALLPKSQMGLPNIPRQPRSASSAWWERSASPIAIWLPRALERQRDAPALGAKNLRHPPANDACVPLLSCPRHILLAPLFGSLDALAVKNRRAGRDFPARFFAGLGAQSVMHFVQRAVLAPAAKLRPHCGVRREVVRQKSPCPAASQQIKHCVEHLALAVFARPAGATALSNRQQLFKTLPLSVRQIRAVTRPFHNTKSNFVHTLSE